MTKTLFFLSTFGTLWIKAGEHVVKVAPFEAKLTLDATFIPSKAEVLKIKPEQWGTFTIKELVEHGSEVTKDTPLIAFDREDYDKRLAETKKSVAARKIALALAERELSDLEITTPRSLEGERIAFERNKLTLDYFTKTDRAISEESARKSLDRAKRSLENVEEELKQLLQMYEEDGLTEETEEIILKRQRAAVVSAQFSLKKATLATKWTLEKTIPQRAVDLQRSFDTAKLSFETATLNLPRTLESKRISVAKLQRDDLEADKKLAELEGDQKFLEFKAPSDGVVYHGEITNNGWSMGTTAKFMFVDGVAPAKTALMSFVADGTPLQLNGSLDQKQRLGLNKEVTGTATVDGLDGQSFPVTIEELDLIPGADGKFRFTLAVTLPDDSPLVGGMKAHVELITYRNEEALAVPKNALKQEGDKSTLRIKMADGKDEVREVTTGQTSGDSVEILEGIAPDQVILIPDPK